MLAETGEDHTRTTDVPVLISGQTTADFFAHIDHVF